MALIVQLTRPDPGTPWGFRMKGGIETCQPLTVSYVVPGGLADCYGLQTGARILTIGGDCTDGMTNQQAQQAVIRCSNDLELEVCDLQYRGYAHPLSYSPNSNRVSTNRSPTTCSTLNIDLHQSTLGQKTYSSALNADCSPPHSRRSFNETVGITYKPTIRPRESRSPCPPSPSMVRESPSYRQWQIPKPNKTAYDKLQYSLNNSMTEKTTPFRTSTTSPFPSLNSLHERQIYLKTGTLRPHNYRNRPVCYSCKQEIHGPFIDTMEHCFCPDHFKCCHCHKPLNDCGFAEHDGRFYCEDDFVKLVAPKCAKCHNPIIGQIMKALNKSWHPHCFTCLCCAKPLKEKFHVEDGDQVVCEEHWQKLHMTPCGRCQQPISEIDRFVEAFGKQFHARCFCCAACQTPLEGKPFHARDNKPFCRVHAHAVALYA